MLYYLGGSYYAGSIDDGLVWSDGLDSWTIDPTGFINESFANPNFIGASDTSQILTLLYPIDNPAEAWPAWWDGSIESATYSTWDYTNTFVTHNTSGDLVGPSSTIVGAATYNAQHLTTGIIAGPNALLAGSAIRFRTFDSTGALVGPNSLIAGAADRQTGAVAHTTTGTLVGNGTTLVGSTTRFRTFTSSGVLVGPGAVVTGSATRFRAFTTSGVLVGQGSVVTGNSERQAQIIPHISTGILVGNGAIIDGTANHISLYPDPSTVTAGIQYGPDGMFVGTLTATGGEAIIALRSFTGKF